MAVFFEQFLIQTSAVHTDADGDVLLLARVHNRAHAPGIADIARIDTDFAGAGLSRGDGEAVIKMDIGHQRQRRRGADLPERACRIHIGNRQTRDLAARRCKRIDLRERAPDIGGPGIEH